MEMFVKFKRNLVNCLIVNKNGINSPKACQEESTSSGTIKNSEKEIIKATQFVLHPFLHSIHTIITVFILTAHTKGFNITLIVS